MKRRPKSRGLLNKLIIIALLIALVFTLLGSLNDQNKKIDVLIKRHNQQQQKMEQLEYESQRLHNVVTYQHEQIKNLQQNASIASQDVEKVEEPKEIHKEEKAYVITMVDPTPSIVIATLATLGGYLRSLLPALP